MRVRALVALAFAWALVAAVPAAAQESGKTALKIGQAQDPQTLNPFIDQDEEDFRVWSINYDLLVNFSPKDLGPVPGIAKSWTISPDKKTITFKLFENHKWSDGQPITSKDVKYSLETFAPNSLLFGSYVENVSKIDTPDDLTVVIHTKRPDARIVGGLFIYILPKHIWGKVPVKDLTGSYQPDIPLVGSGPYVVTDFQPNRFLKMERNPDFRGPAPAYDKIEFIRYGNQDAAERALQLGGVDIVPEVSPAGFERLGNQDNIDTFQATSPAYTQLAFNVCPPKICPDANRNPAVMDRAVRQAVAYATDRERINAIAAQGTSFPGHGILPSFYKSFYEQPADDYPYDPEKAKQILDDAGWVDNGSGARTKGNEELSFNLYVRSEATSTIQAAKLIAEEAGAVGIDFNVQVVSTDKLYDLTVRKVDGKPAPDYDTFIWGWGGDPYDPSFLLGVLTTDQIGDSSDSYYSNPEYDRLFEQQAGEYDTAARKEIIQRMVAITQRDLPYLVLTEDPNLEAYRTDRVANVEPVCPEAAGGDIICDQTSYAALLKLAPVAGAVSNEGGGQSVGFAVLAAIVFGGAGWFFGSRASR